MELSKKNLNIFLNSSFFSVITIAYLGYAFYNKGRPQDVSFELFVIFIPLVYGIVGVINNYITEMYGDNYSLLVGGLLGILLSTIGRFVLNLPTKIFDFNKSTEYQVHLYAMILYALIFRFIITPVNNYLIK